ncbi:5-dehydro-2-deoxygluconokinase [Marinococcus halophilus]|uniref:5-dehydro-2-deoxygluconokinase n=1 Tax=Marinococcus halophilus TaxID=1371 RepID=UPI0009A81AF9|nr:5-dehydro-2-deoxygluconokinase [Marinococcus halophilus]
MNNMKFATDRTLDIVALGRIGVDLNANEINCPMEEVVSFTKTIGGSPANIAFGTSRLGLKTGFIGKVANDGLGRYCLKAFKDNDIDRSNVLIDQSKAVNGLAFTEIISPSESNHILYRNNVADLNLAPEDINEAYIKSTKILLISGTALSQSPSREAVFLAVEYAKKHHTKVVLDIDYRPYSWRSKKETAIYYNLIAEKCDLIIGTREEFDTMSIYAPDNTQSDQQLADKWLSCQANLVVIKHGSEGSWAYTDEGTQFKGKTFPTKVLKTFGAGDSYAAGLIHGLLEDRDIDKCLEFGSAAAAIVISKNSSSEAMPTLEELYTFIDEAKARKEME